MDAKYSIGQPLVIKATGEVVTVADLSEGLNGMQYIVYQGKKKIRLKESALEPYTDPDKLLVEKIKNDDMLNADEFQKFYYYNMFSENQEKNIYSYQGNKIIFNPFQYKPLMKFLANDSDERLLIADEVGVGKTIESGLILDELISRGDISNQDFIMIICPNVLTKKWRDEMLYKFGFDDFRIHDGKSLEYMLNTFKNNERISDKHSIVSEQTIRAEKYQELLEECRNAVGGPFIKMLIIDECHHYRNDDTNTHKLGEIVSSCSEKVLMLSATPFNLRSSDLYNQLHILNPGLFPDEDEFEQLKVQIRSVNQCISHLRKNEVSELRKEMLSLCDLAHDNVYIGDKFDEMHQVIKSKDCFDVKEITEFENIFNMLNPISSSFTRTLKRDALEHRVTREVRTVEVKFTESERRIYDKFLDVNLMRYRMEGVNERAFNLILNGLERIASSSIVALESNVKRYLSSNDIDEIEVYEETGLNDSNIKSMKALVENEYAGLFKQIKNLNGVDSKYSSFKHLIDNIKQTQGDNSQIIVFSFYVGTLKYLRRKLTEDGYRVALMYGGTPMDTPSDSVDEDGFKIIGRNDVMNEFKEGNYDIMLLSEVGGEGLDFQFCSSLINYDIPYNPMRIEQRIGRIDRMGQKADKIVVGNLCVSGSIDMIINRVLIERVENASDLVGDLEPIIAREMEEINKLIIRKEFTPAELEKREKEMYARIEKERLTREEFDSIRYELSNDAGFREEFEEKIKSSRVSPKASLRFTNAFLATMSGCTGKALSDSTITFKLSKDLKEKVAAKYKKDPSPELKALINADDKITVSFEGNEAYESGQVFFKPSGSWIRFILDYMRNIETDQGVYFGAEIEKSDVLPVGQYFIFGYEFTFKGFRNTVFTDYVIINSDTGDVVPISAEAFDEHVLKMKKIKVKSEINLDNFDDAMNNAIDEADALLEKIENQLAGTNSIKVESRIEALNALSKARVSKLQNDIMASSSQKKIDSLQNAIKKEKEKTREKIEMLKEKTKLVSSVASKGLCVLIVK